MTIKEHKILELAHHAKHFRYCKEHTNRTLYKMWRRHGWNLLLKTLWPIRHTTTIEEALNMLPEAWNMSYNISGEPVPTPFS